MESCVSGQWDRVGPVEVDDIRRDLLRDFTDLPPQERSESQVENLQVYLRVRPLTAAESSAHTQDCVTLEGPDTAVLKAPRISQSNKQNDKPLPQTAQRFTFTQVFGPDSGQKTVFDGSVRSSVRDVLDGGNCLVFTYGVTNAGKTFTFLGPEHDSGLLPRSLAVIFNSIEGRLYGRCDLKPQRCRDFSRLTPDQLAAETSSKKNLLRLLKESDRSATFSRSTFLDGSLGSDSSGVSEVDSFCLDVESNVRFSVWVSFCEIYNDNIHDLLEQVPSGHHKRTVLRLSQDVKGNSFIKDLRWVQVNSSEEAYRVMKIGKKNQSFSSTRLNHLSSRSHSIFSIRILRVDDVGVPRVLGISELVLCDLAGSERCSRTQNTGERLKEAGNINNSLLTLGKCLHAMRQNQNAKFQHHIPFRESKLTHFLQFFFCGAGRVSMVVNINQNAACYDETLNVLKFSSLAQKVVVLSSRPPVLDDAPRRSALEVSMIIDEADQRRDVLGRRRKSSLVAWETSLEDVLEDEDGEEWDEEEEEEEEESVMEGTVLEAGGEEEEQEEEERTMEEEPKQADGAALRLLLEAQIREEVSNEFMELFTSMEKDYRERLEKEKEILEERADRRFEILKNLGEELTSHHVRSTGGEEEQEERRKRQRDEEEEEERGEPAKKRVVLEEEIWRLNVENNKKEETIVQLRERGERMEEELRRREEEVQKERSRVEEELRRREVEVEKERSRVEEEVEKERSRVEEELRRREEEVEKERSRVEEEVEKERLRVEEELRRREEEVEKERSRVEEELRRREEEVEKERSRVEEELRRREEEVEKERSRVEEELRRREEEVEELKKEQKLKADECPGCASLFASLQSDQRESCRLMKENKALINGMFQLQTQVTELQKQLIEQTGRSDSLSEQLDTSKTRLQELESQSEEKTNIVKSLTQEVGHLRQEVKEGEGQSSSVFHASMEQLKKESEAALQRSAQTCQLMEELQREKSRLEETLTHSEKRCERLTEELANQKAEFSHQLQSLRAELESEGRALRGGLELESEGRALRGGLEERRGDLLEETLLQTKIVRQELERLKENLLEEENLEEENLLEKEEENLLEKEEENLLEEEKENLLVEENLLEKEEENLEEEKENLLEEEKENLLEEEKENLLVEEEENLLEEEKENLLEKEEENLQKEEEEENLQRKEQVDEERTVSVVEELKQELQRVQGRSRRSREFEAVKREMERLKETKTQSVLRSGGRVLNPEQDVPVSSLRSNMADRKRKSSEVQDLVFSENKRNRLRTNKQNQEQKDGTLQKIGDLIQNSPSRLRSKAKTIIGLVSGHPVGKETVTTATKETVTTATKETVTTATKLRRGRRKLFQGGVTTPLLDSPQMSAVAEEEKESDHLIIKRQLRSKTCRK